MATVNDLATPLEPAQRVRHYFRVVGQLGGWGAACLGALTLVGWATGNHWLQGLGVDAIAMALESAVTLLLLGAAQVTASRDRLAPWAGWAIRFVGLLVLAYVTIRLGELITGMDLGTARLLPHARRLRYGPPSAGRMTFFGAVNGWFAAAALLLVIPSPQQRPASRAARFLALVLALTVLSMSLVFSLGYLFGSPFFYGQPAVPMAFNTALAFFSMGVGLVAFMGPEVAPLANLLGTSIPARLLRAFLPFTVITIAVVAGLTHVLGGTRGTSQAALVTALLTVAAMFLASFLCDRIAQAVSFSLEEAEDKLRQAEQESRHYAARLEVLNASLERRVAERTAALEAGRDRLDQFFTILTSLQNPDNAEKTFDLVLSFCQRLGYDQAMLSLVDRDAGVVRAVKAVGALANIVEQTVRPLDGGDILACVAREGKPAIIPDASQDPRCEQGAVAATGIRGLVVLPLVSGEVVGILQVASASALCPALEELRALETLGSEAARALHGLEQLERIRQLNRQLGERNEQLQKLANDLELTAVAERRARDAQRESEARLRLLLESSGEGVYGVDREGRCTFINKAAAEMLGSPPSVFLGSNMHALIHNRRPDGTPYPVSECAIFRVFQTGRGCRVDNEMFWPPEGQPFPVEYTASPIREGDAIHGAVVTFTDITKRKEAEEALHFQNTLLQQIARSEREAHEELKKAQSQLVQSEKLAALGQMVAGVAHEINNPLSFVGNNLAVLQRDVASLRELLLMYQEAADLLRQQRTELVDRITALAERIDLEYTLSNLDGLMARSRDGVKRIQNIVKDLRDFARLDESDLQEFDLNAGVESTLNILRYQAKKHDVELLLDTAPLPPVTCYPAKVNQVVLNLVANAIDACSAGGRVTVRTRPRAGSVAIEVQDTGCGIDPAIRDRIFDPFFTTKPPGQGTGLGLSISYQIVQDHGGTIEVDSAPGRGTCFMVRLPVQPPLDGPRPHLAEAAPPGTTSRPPVS